MNELILHIECKLCHKLVTVVVKRHDYFDWKEGKLAQDAFPYLSEGEREVIMSMICEPCFDEMFEEEDDSEHVLSNDGEGGSTTREEEHQAYLESLEPGTTAWQEAKWNSEGLL